MITITPQWARTGLKQGTLKLWQWGWISFETGVWIIHALGVQED